MNYNTARYLLLLIMFKSAIAGMASAWFHNWWLCSAALGLLVISGLAGIRIRLKVSKSKEEKQRSRWEY